MLEDDEVGRDLLAAEASVSLVAVGGFSVKLAVKMIQRRLRYVHSPSQRKSQHSTTTLLLRATIRHCAAGA